MCTYFTVSRQLTGNPQMSRLSRNLLLLSKIENNQYKNFSNVNLCKKIQDLLPNLESLLATLGLSPTSQTRFYREKVTQKGNGLGLAIVKSICDYHKWAIHYYYKEGLHHFEITFSNYSAPYYMISCLAVVLQQGMRCISNFRSS